MFLIVGLGNPGKKYENTRHNIGFSAIGSIAADFQFTIFNFQSISNSKVSKGEIANKKVILAKPQTFMNESGKAVKFLTRRYKLDANKLVVIHDDIDLPLGKIKISKDSGSGGHKGVVSIIESFGTKNFIRLRMGIQPKSGKPERVENFVLKKFAKTEEKILEEVIKKTTEAIEIILKEGLEKAMNEFNK